MSELDPDQKDLRIIEQMGELRAMARAVKDAQDKADKAEAEAIKLKAILDAFTSDKPDIHSLYWGAYHSEPACPMLIDAVWQFVFKAFCAELGVERYCGYEGEDGLDDAVHAEVRSVLRAARVMNDDNEIARHAADQADTSAS